MKPRNCAWRASKCSDQMAPAASKTARASSVLALEHGSSSRSLEAASASSSVWPRTTTVSCSRSDASPSRETRPSPWVNTRFGKPAAGDVDAIDEIVDPLAEISRQGFAGDGQARRHRLAVQADRFGGLRAAVGDAADDSSVVLASAVERPPSRRPNWDDDAVAVTAQRLRRRRRRSASMRLTRSSLRALKSATRPRRSRGCADRCRPRGAMMSSALRPLASASRAATSAPTAVRDSCICAPCAAIRSTVAEPARSIAWRYPRRRRRSRWRRARRRWKCVRRGARRSFRDRAAMPLVRVVDHRAHAAAVGDDGLALVGHFGDQRANAAFVVGIGALERRDFGTHQRLELGGARQRALDAVAHRGDFAADRLGERGDMLARHRFGLGEPQRDLGDRARRDAQFLQAARQGGKAEEQDRRSERRQARAAPFPAGSGHSRAPSSAVRSGRAEVRNRVGHAQRQPDGRRDRAATNGARLGRRDCMA